MDKFMEMEEPSASSDDSTMTEDLLRRSIEKSQDYLLSRQHEKGYWVDELEANVTISAELIFFMHFTDRLDACLLYTSPSPRDATLARMPSSA